MYFDAYYSTHVDCKGHTWAILTLGGEMVGSFSSKQKINVKHSTEVELIGVDDRLPQVLYNQYFLEEQGYGIEQNVIIQYNKSCFMLKRNGKSSHWKQSKHMVRYFFIEVKIAQKEVERKYCPTEKMLQYCNKASMSKFKDMRSMVRKCSIDYNDQNGVGLHNAAKNNETNTTNQCLVTTVSWETSYDHACWDGWIWGMRTNYTAPSY